MKDYFGQNIRCYFAGKICYTAREAGEVINCARKHHNCYSFRKGKNIPKRKYLCETCGYYHVTHHSFYTDDEKKSNHKR